MDWLKVNSIGRFLLYGLLILAVLAIVAGLLARSPSSEASLEAGAALAMISAVALGIERAQEVFWAAIDSRYGAWWPLSLVTKPVRDLQKRLDAELAPYVVKAKVALAELDRQGQLAQGELAKLNENLDNAQRELQSWGGMITDARALKRVLTAIQTNLASVQGRIPQGQSALAFGDEAVDLLTGVLDSVTSNPARRTIGIFIGAAIGIVIAATFGLDIFFSMLGSETAFTIVRDANGSSLVTLHAGVAISGIIIGLGADPTHQVIRLLEEKKKELKERNR